MIFLVSYKTFGGGGDHHHIKKDFHPRFLLAAKIFFRTANIYSSTDFNFILLSQHFCTPLFNIFGFSVALNSIVIH